VEGRGIELHRHRIRPTGVGGPQGSSSSSGAFSSSLSRVSYPVNFPRGASPWPMCTLRSRSRRFGVEMGAAERAGRPRSKTQWADQVPVLITSTTRRSAARAARETTPWIHFRRSRFTCSSVPLEHAAFKRAARTSHADPPREGMDGRRSLRALQVILHVIETSRPEQSWKARGERLAAGRDPPFPFRPGRRIRPRRFCRSCTRKRRTQQVSAMASALHRTALASRSRRKGRGIRAARPVRRRSDTTDRAVGEGGG